MNVEDVMSWVMSRCDLGSLAGECTFHGLELARGYPVTIPTVVAGLVVLLFVFFVYASLRLGWCSFRYQRRFKKLVGVLKKERAAANGLGRTALNRVGEILGKNPLCEHGWREFTETIVSEGTGDAERIYNTRQAEEFFSEEEIVEESMHPTFFRAVPGVLTSLGLLGTFIAILLGLAAIHIPSSETGRIEGIDLFVNALSGKFLSSVIALIFAILFTLMETRVLHRAHQTYRNFCQSFDAVFPRHTAEEVLMAMNLELQGQRSAFEHFNTDLSTRFRDGVKEGLGPVMERIVEGLQSITGERDNNIESLLDRLTTEFRNSITQSAGVEFGQIASAMEQASQLISQANEQTGATRASFQNLVRAMEESRTRQVEVSERQATTMNEILEKMVSTISQASTNSQSAVDATLRDIMERSNRESQESARAFQETLRQYSTSINETVSALCDRVEDASTRMESAGANGSRDLAESIQRVTEQLERVTTGVVERTGSSSERVIGELSRVLEEHRVSISAISEAREALERTLIVWSQSAEQMRGVVLPLRDASVQLGGVTANLNNVASDLQGTQQRVGEIFAGVQAEMQRMKEMGETSGRLLAEHMRVFDTVQSGLGGTLTTITEKLETLQEVATRGLTGQLKEFDNHLGTATRKLGAAVDELSDALDNAVESIANAGVKSVESSTSTKA